MDGIETTHKHWDPSMYIVICSYVLFYWGTGGWDGIMSNGTQAEPWIEELIQNYGTRQRTTRVLARVLRVLENHAARCFILL